MKELNLQVMQDSYNGISFYSEKRGQSDYDYYSELLKNDLKELGENQGNYREKFITKVMDMAHKRSRCISPMITGPANFPVRSNEKNFSYYENSLNHFDYWRTKYFKAVNRVRTLSPEDEIDNAVNEIDKLIKYQIKIKETNKIIRKYNLTKGTQFGFEKDEKTKEGVNLLIDLWDDNALVDTILNPSYGSIGFASFELTSISTKIKARKLKIENMKSRIKHKSWSFNFDGGSMYIENDRVIISHDEKPSKEIIQDIKSSGFRWSPKMGNWCRKHTGNARYSAELLLKKWENK